MTDEPRLKVPKHVHRFEDRNGKTRYYLRRPGFKGVPLPGLLWSPTFMAAYEAAMAGAPPPPIGIDQIKAGSLRAVAADDGRLVMFVPAPQWAYQGRIQSALLANAPRVAMAVAGALNGFFQHWHLYELAVWRQILAQNGFFRLVDRIEITRCNNTQ